MQVQRVNNQQSFTATMKYERAIPERLHLFAGKKESVVKDKFNIHVDYALMKIKSWLTERKAKRVLGIQKTESFVPNVYKEPVAIQINDDIFVLEESMAPNNFNFPSKIRVLFGKDASDGIATFKKGAYQEDTLFEEAADLIKLKVNQ